mmetsp:Transcript_14174/g.27600  ORF Transcript_14174/g.27600 Transcript_14174/m.27600 type:complete len:82 (+) Transcript_14174:104-349(+)
MTHGSIQLCRVIAWTNENSLFHDEGRILIVNTCQVVFGWLILTMNTAKAPAVAVAVPPLPWPFRLRKEDELEVPMLSMSCP